MKNLPPRAAIYRAAHETLAALELRCQTRESFSQAFAEELGRGLEWCDKGADTNHPPLPSGFLTFGYKSQMIGEETRLVDALDRLWYDGLDDAAIEMNEIHARLQPTTAPKEG